MDGIYMFSLYKIYISRIRHVSPREQAKCHKTLFFYEFHFIKFKFSSFYTLWWLHVVLWIFFFCCGELKHDTFAYAARDSRIFMLSIPYMMW